MAETRDSDIVLAPNEYAFVLDQNSGSIQPAVGPTKRTLENTEKTVNFDRATGKFVETSTALAKHLFTIANERSYIILENPANGDKKHPTKGRDNPMPDLQWGKKQNIPGPDMFPLWPGQVATVLEGHQLRSNQYLVCVVDNAAEAIKNWSSAIMDKVADSKESVEKKSLKTGQILIIKGTEVSYYIPPTGISVVPDEGEYVRDAVTLERLEYSILLDENGNKRYEKGPAVVFPGPTETFIAIDGKRKFNAIELNEQMGLYIKVTADYEEDGKSFKAGDEIFITGKEQKIYYPRPEHSLIKYGDRTRHYAIAIPKGEGRYVLNKETGDIRTVKGPNMFLPDPRKDTIIRRILSDAQVQLWFPGNNEALEYNRDLARKAAGDKYYKDEEATRQGMAYLNSDSDDTIRTYTARTSKGAMPVAAAMMMASASNAKPSSRDFDNMYKDSAVAGDRMNRGTSFTPPRSIVLDTKYEGAVVINVWPGYAIQVVSKTGEREVVVGPQSIILEYDQVLEMMSLSTGKPKTDNTLIHTVYLQVKNNRVSDEVDATTKDMVDIKARVNYRLHFENDPKAWFSVDNYIKFLTQNLRSMIRSEIKKHTIQDVSDNIAAIIRDLILGKHEEDKDREGRVFEENGMHIIDVEILGMTIGDDRIRNQILTAQYSSVENAVAVLKSNQTLEAIKQLETNKKIEIETKLETSKAEAASEKAKIELLKENEVAKAEKDFLISKKEDETAQVAHERHQMEIDQEIKELESKTTIEVGAFKKQMGAIQPGLIEAIQSVSDKELASTLAEHLPAAGGGIGMVMGAQLIDNLTELVKGTPMEKALQSIGKKAKKNV